MTWITKVNRIWVAVLGTVLLMISTGLAETKGPVKPTREDKCPVCGMFVYKYPDWLAEIILKDESVDFFDGAKDLFRYYFGLRKYKLGKTKKDIAAIYVTEYYEIKLIDARKAFFVVGSDVYGPMGHELIPFAMEEDARTFMKDHKGKRILQFGEITPLMIEKLD
jgi:nitrous oxide reductase accessory protein NosL